MSTPTEKAIAQIDMTLREEMPQGYNSFELVREWFVEALADADACSDDVVCLALPSQSELGFSAELVRQALAR